MQFSTYIIIVTYNAKPWIKKCLESIDLSKYTTVIVDNSSQDDTVHFVRENFSSIKILPQEENLGFGQANNLGISYALKQGANHVFLLNQDAYLVEDVLDKLIAFQLDNKKYGILSPIHLNAAKTKLDRNFANFLKYDKNPFFFSDFVLGNKLKKVYDVPFVNAAGWLISRACLMAVGGFDPIFYHYGEDDNYCQRVKYHDFKIGVLPNTHLIHDRENREKPFVKPFSKEYYSREIRKFKVKYANVNDYDKSEIIKYKNRIKKQMVKAFFETDSYKIKNVKAYLKLVNQSIPQIEESVKNNKKPKPSYLNV